MSLQSNPFLPEGINFAPDDSENTGECPENQQPADPSKAEEPWQKGQETDKADKIDDMAEVQRLAELSPLVYDRQRVEAANALGVRPAVLDKVVNAARKQKPEAANSLCYEPEPWSDPVNPAELLTEIAVTIKRFIVCSDETAHAAALWVAMTWFIDEIKVAPLAVITAPEMRCGKSVMLTLMGKLVVCPVTASNISPAALYRLVDQGRITLLVDEADTFMKHNEEFRGVINSGHTRDSAYVIRSVGDNHVPTKFSTWGSKVIAGIDARCISRTMTDRAILLELRRKLPHEQVDALRHTDSSLFEVLAAKLSRFAVDHQEDVRQARPVVPQELNDRAQDNWAPLLAIADIAGGPWPALARAAALKVSGEADAPATTGTELLADIQEIFSTEGTDRISTTKLITALCQDEEKRWATYNRGLPIKVRQVAGLLRSYGIKSGTIRQGQDTFKGYKIEQFTEAFARYLPPPPSVTTSQPACGKALPVTDSFSVTVTENLSVTPEPAWEQGCDVVTDRDPMPLIVPGGPSRIKRAIDNKLRQQQDQSLNH